MNSIFKKWEEGSSGDMMCVLEGSSHEEEDVAHRTEMDVIKKPEEPFPKCILQN